MVKIYMIRDCFICGVDKKYLGDVELIWYNMYVIWWMIVLVFSVEKVMFRVNLVKFIWLV